MQRPAGTLYLSQVCRAARRLCFSCKVSSFSDEIVICDTSDSVVTAWPSDRRRARSSHSEHLQASQHIYTDFKAVKSCFLSEQKVV